jgi:hypothetical protein
VGIQGLQQIRTLYNVWRAAIAPRASVLLFIASAAVTTGCTPAIHSAASSLYKITTGASQNTSADHLVVVTEPGNSSVNSAIGPTVVVEFVNQAGQVDTSANSVVTVSIGTNPASGALSGSMSAVAVNGIATFPGLSINSVGNGYTLVASSSGIAPAPTTAFNIMPGTPSKLVFATEPASAASGASLGSISVKIEDANGNLDNHSVLPITLTIGNNAGPGGTLSGSMTVNAVNGIATCRGYKKISGFGA